MSYIERVTEVSQSRNARTSLSDLTTKINKLNNDISSGSTVRTASDNPLAISNSLNFKAEQSALLQYQKNISVVDSIISFSTKTLEGFNDAMVRSQELATLTNNVLAQDSFTAYAVEVNQLLEQAVSLGNQKYLDQFLFAGTNTALAPFSVTRDSSNNITAVSFTGNSSQAQIQVDPNTTMTPFADSQTTSNMLASINSLIALRNAMQVGDSTTIQSLQTTQLIPESQDVGQSIARLGSISSRIQFSSASNDTLLLNIESSISQQISTDVSNSIINLSQLETAYQASTAIYAKLLKQSGLVDFLKYN